MVLRAPASKRSPEKAEERLLVEAAQKDPTRFADLYEINFERVYAFIAWRVADRDAAEDLTSEVFHKALANLRRFEWRGAPFAAWLLRIAANAIADKAQRGKKELAVDDPPEIAEDASVLADLEEVERLARLFRLVEQLPEDQRRVIAMRFAEEKSIHEIAERLGRTEGAVKQLQFRGLQTLRAKIEDAKPQRAQSHTKRMTKPVDKDA
ncbi:MAG TPA: sigma-70 family RNA polymerase sigma factor [Terriglobales bacterium]|jgi:RNA polymerase sigma-70 factor (ECF subfamily)|nr:sigma-70 family RNA polymerase sigma factor [Terriglobales bacterium]